jgi:(2Fe-2S) ferredoxin
MKYEKHIFICANQKGEGKTCCGQDRGLELVEKFREVLKENGLQGKVRAQRAGCLDECKNGPSLVIYPEGIYYGKVTPDRVEEIVKTHILENKIVKDLELTFEKE